MKSRGTLLLSAIFVLAAFVAAVLPETAPPGDKESVIIQTMMRNLERFHYQPMDIDDEFSERAYDYYLNDIDGARLFFTAEDLAAFAPNKLAIDDQIAAGSYEFFDLAQERWMASLDKTEKWYKEILAKPFNVDKGGEIKMRDDDSGWSKNDKELRQYWEDYMKRDIINQIVNKQEEYETAVENRAKMTDAEKTTADEEDPLVEQSVAELEQEAREKLLERYDDWFERMRKAKLSARRSQYLNALTSMFDPHTTYYRPKDKESFDIRFSGRLEGIGATLQNKDQYTKISTLVVGGPAWKSKELEVDDLILSVRQKGEEEAIDIKDMLVEDVVGFIRGKKGTTVFLKIKKPDGTIKEVSIVRDIIVIDDNYAKSLIIDGVDEDQKVGYINLPSFYADFQNEDGRFSAKDIKAELIKLKDRDVDGVILDLRNNGGGSLRDVIDMSGFFIPEGPIVQVAGRGGRKEILADKDPSVVWDGPLIVLVNQYSASASEILAAALQDYNRAVIVGSTQTFGKGTVQRFIDMDRTIPGRSDIKPLGTVKLTMQKFYRVNGGATQLRGVVPDIILPDSRALLETGERQQTGPLPWTEIAAVEYDQDVYRIPFMETLRERSGNRVAQDPVFLKILENAKRFKRQRDQDTYPLNLPAYYKMIDANKKEAKQFEDLFESDVNFNVTNIEVDLEEIKDDESKVARNEEFKKGVAKDVYIHEALNILKDMRELE
ncbi:tail-specific protease [Neolewinella aurantiaca]|uniref:Tail-specific protease n=1 Tax=Neolewinella aurantiaca TaxID=2602767 RepID=A0A5C7FEA4_9BACT|nr:carboxy terminal-processing peptidase [Neolewinella aurantiaca]TXF89407.1 tail-specific protease [Neolewinella aurantiaca]